MRYLPIFIFLFVFLFVLNTPLYAGTFQLKSIGSIAVNGATYKHWWIVSATPRFVGSAMTSSDVAIVIDGVSSSVVSNSSGDWSYTSPTLKDGDHQVSFASSGSSIYFTLTTGSAVPSGIQAPPAQTLPISGSITPLLGLMVGGLSLLGVGYKLKRG